VDGQLIYQKPFFYVTKGGFTSGVVPSLYTGINPKSGVNVAVLANLIDLADPTDAAGPATGFLVSNKGCTKLQSTGAGCTTTNPEATFNVPLKCLITVKAFRAAVDEITLPAKTSNSNLRQRPCWAISSWSKYQTTGSRLPATATDF
jgi:hypothetical protein